VTKITKEETLRETYANGEASWKSVKMVEVMVSISGYSQATSGRYMQRSSRSEFEHKAETLKCTGRYSCRPLTLKVVDSTPPRWKSRRNRSAVKGTCTAMFNANEEQWNNVGIEAARMEERRKIDESEKIMEDPYGPVEAVMTSPVTTVRPDDPLEVVLPHFQHFTGLPVVNDNGQCVGVVSNIDVAKHAKKKSFSVKTTTVREVMTSPAYVIMTKAPVAYAAGLMLQHKIHRLPVVDNEGHVTGIITRTDIFEPLSPSWNAVYHAVLGDHSWRRNKVRPFY
jgi:CBS domain-containing protein